MLTSCTTKPLVIVSAGGQNQPVMGEISGFKTSHFLGRKTASLSRVFATEMRHVQLPSSELTRNDLQFIRPRVVPAAHWARVEDRPGNGWAVFTNPVKPGHSAPRLSGGNGLKMHHFAPRQFRAGRFKTSHSARRQTNGTQEPVRAILRAYHRKG